MFKVKNLSKTIRNKKILKDLNFEIDHGKIAIFLGGSGAGKSTLLRILNNLENYDSGSFSLDDTLLNLENVNHSHTIGMVFQHFNLFENLNAEDNIIYTLIHCKGLTKDKAKAITEQLLLRYGLQDHAKSSVNNLSGGQKQRLAIARTLAVDPQIICLDEPTSALDPRLTNQVAKYITELAAENRVVILTTHDMNLLEQLEGHLFLMENGMIIENALKSNCMSNPKSYPKLHAFLKGTY
ncbi:MAG: ATP-binding cassette domain-containing protein [Parachlamydiaceae bacterium]|nr:ATP-binding cassette domain-containing protein [Parachlamydiaceae bacterium]